MFVVDFLAVEDVHRSPTRVDPKAGVTRAPCSEAIEKGADHVLDSHATMLPWSAPDGEKLTCRHEGHGFWRSDVHGSVVSEILV